MADLTAPKQEWRALAEADGRTKAIAMLSGYKCACGEAAATFAKSAKMEAGEGIGASAYRLCKDCKCYACGLETAEIKTK
jgi:hypothetical protein